MTTITVIAGETVTFTITANSGYAVSAVMVDGVAAASSSYTLSDGTTIAITGTMTNMTLVMGNIQGSHSLSITFSGEYTITYTSSAGGTITAVISGGVP